MAKTAKVVITKKRRKEGGKGAKKYGRNKVKCARYKAEGRREKNKIKKQKRVTRLLAKKRNRVCL
jgi:hypothetical protein